MKKVLATGVLISFFFIACSKPAPASNEDIQAVQPYYDTTAVDSFSAGATSVDIVRQIRMSSQHYQDSLKEAIKLEIEEKRITEELEKENKRKSEAEKKLKNTESPTGSPTKTE
nr:hypothetical protein [uncultured Chryseobacterium sp.]